MIAPTIHTFAYDPTTWEGFGEFTVTVALSPEDKAIANELLEKEHPLGEFRPVGHSLMHLIREDGQPVAAIQWAACAYHLKDREAWIGWNAQTCARRRNLIVNNVRFVIPEATRRPNLASKALAHAVRALPGHWHEHFSYEPLLCETFTDIESHAGTCYKAAGWTPLGLTEGNSRQRAEFYVANKRPKKLWIKPLRPDSRERLNAVRLDPAHVAGETSGKGAPLPITAAQLKPLAEALRAVPDPRRRNRQHPIGPMLCMIALGLLCGGDNLNAIVRHANRLTQAQRRVLGARSTRTSPGSRTWYYHVPAYETFRRLLLAIDLDAFGQVLTSWLSAHRGALPADLALDGKVVRDQLGTIVTLCDTEQKVPVAIAATTAPGGEHACARKLLRSDEVTLHNTVVSLDGLYTNNENARIIVQEKGGDYLISVKENQPTLSKEVDKELGRTPLFAKPPESRNGTVIEYQIACAAVSSEHVGFAHALQAVQVNRTVTDKKTQEATSGSRQFIASIAHQSGHAAAMQMGRVTRNHWRVENNIHWLRDAVCDEDACRSRDPNSACALALLRTALLAAVRASGRESLTQALEEFAADRHLAVALIANQRLASLLA